jgi:hypothetical protein
MTKDYGLAMFMTPLFLLGLGAAYGGFRMIRKGWLTR